MSGHYMRFESHICSVQAKYRGLEKQRVYVIIDENLRISSRNFDMSKVAVY